VDDDGAIHKALACLLYAASGQAVMLTSGEAFLQTDMERAPDCLVVDVWLPGMTGVELLEHLVATGSALPAVMITGLDDLQMRIRAMQGGGVAYFLKPLDGPELLQAIQQALDRRHQSGRS
jgi:two-component system CheB/CheR fusion protein